MKKKLLLAFVCVLALCGIYAFKLSGLHADNHKEQTVSDSIISLEKQSWEAWKNHDGKFFQNFLSDDHVEIGSGGISNKAGVVAFVTNGGCVVQDYTGERFKATVFDANTVLLTYHASQKTTCGSFVVPSPAWVSSLYQKRNGKWLNVSYQQTVAGK